MVRADEEAHYMRDYEADKANRPRDRDGHARENRRQYEAGEASALGAHAHLDGSFFAECEEVEAFRDGEEEAGADDNNERADSNLGEVPVIGVVEASHEPAVYGVHVRERHERHEEEDGG